ncbi:MFS transporter [Kocuria indica]|uniref:MFS transporter n=1 Tax=Kocuria marina subsp. indica TaxID=1049583 RepID=A0A6N9QY73_9MICC|nr:MULTISPECIES: MFS transporter [Kocuria]MCT1616984.1 MFS transporter [Kocuria marina]NDO78109.1 MFS transporter [Kocuria indica]
MTTAPLTPRTRTRPGKVMGATLLGTSIEWYDFAIYSMAAAVVIPQVFFPYLDPGSGILSSFATLAIASVARPAGALLFGWIGDTAGRRPALIGSMLVMTVATVGIGFIPGYASIGIMAPVLLVLLRVLQSLAVGGEWGGATSYAVEAAPPRWRAVFGAFPQMGNSLGIFLSSAVFTLAALPGQEFFLETGWRIPFWVAGGLGLIGLWLRFSIEESQEFLETKQNRIVNPHAQKARMRPGLLLLGMSLAGIFSAGAYGVVGTYVTSWFDTETLQRSISLAYQIAGVLGVFTPMAAQLLTNAAGTSWVPVAVLYVVLSVISFWCVASRREGPLAESDDDAARPASAPAR